MTLHIRPFDYSVPDYEAIVDIDNLAWGDDPITVENWKFADESRPSGYLFRRLVAEVDGRVVGMGQIGEPASSYEPGKYWLDVTVHPDFRRQGVGTALYEQLLGLLDARPVHKLTSWTRESHLDALRFLEQRGFRQIMRYPLSKLDVSAFDAARFADKVQQVEAAGDIELKTLAQLLAEDPDCKAKLYDATWEWLQDVPHPAPRTRHPPDVWEKRTFEDPQMLADGWFVAVANGRYVGITTLKHTNEDQLETSLTAVSRDYRRRGLATALKVTAINYAQEHGYQQITTENEENNPMFQLNVQLGFVPEPAGLDYLKEFDNDTAHPAI